MQMLVQEKGAGAGERCRRKVQVQHLSQTKIQARLRIMLMEKVAVTEGLMMGGLRYTLGRREEVRG